MGESRNDHFFSKILFLPVMTLKITSNQKNIAVLPIAKPYLFDIVLRKKTYKAVAALKQAYP